MSDQELAKLATGAFKPDAAGLQAPPRKGAWGFKAIAPWISNPTPDYLKQLEVANYLFGKPLFLIPRLMALAAIAAALFLAALWPWLPALLDASIPTVVIAMVLLVILANKVAPRLEKMFSLFKILRASAEILYRLLFIAIPSVLGTGFIQLYIKFINPLYLKRGSVAELKRREPRS